MWRPFAGIALALLAAPAAAVDGIAVELGSGEGADMGRVALQWRMKKRWLRDSKSHLGGYWDVALGSWNYGAPGPGQNDEVVDIGVTPVLRYQRNSGAGLYVEGGIGAHLLSHSQLGDRRFSTLVQFGTHVGIGIRFGDKGRFDVSYRHQHLSNGGIKEPNNGIDFDQIRVRYHF
jgi:lipid A 3-O-deacylase